jgi:hypothetical protein
MSNSRAEAPTSPRYVFTPAELDDLLRGTCRRASEYWRRGWDSEGAATRAASETLDRLEAERAP